MKWYFRFHQAIVPNMFVMVEEDHYVHVKQSKDRFLLLSLYVNDILLIGNNKEMIIATLRWFSSTFEMDMREANYVLEVKILRNCSRRLLSLSEKTYIKKILQ